MVGWKQWLTRIAGDSAGVRAGLLVAVIAVLSPLVFVRYSAEPVMVPLLDLPVDGSVHDRLVQHLESQGIPLSIEDGRIRVPLEQRVRLLAAVRAEEILPKEAAGFDALLKDQKWYHSSEQNRQLFTLALQGRLSKELERFPWVQSATVILSQPGHTGFGATHRRPTASVNLVTHGQPLDQGKVDAIAGLVSGAVAEMQPGDVAVVDAAAGRQWRAVATGPARAEVEADPARELEESYRRKILDALGYIENVIVVVDVEVERIRPASTSRSVVGDGFLEVLRSEWNGGRPGAGTVLRAGGDTAEDPEPGIGPDAEPMRINATVNVPRSYFASVYNRGNPLSPEPSDVELGPVLDEQLQKIRMQIAPLTRARGGGQLGVNVYPDHRTSDELPREPQPKPTTARFNLEDGPRLWAGLSAAGLLAVGALVWIVRRSTRSSPMPAQPADEPLMGASEESPGSGPFSAFRGSDSRRVLAAIRDEHPQTMALVLSHLPRHQAAEVLEGLPTADQVEVVKRLGGLGPADPATILEVERELEPRLSGGRCGGTGGAEEIANVLRSVGPAAARSIFEGLEIEDPALADEVRHLMFDFQDLLSLDDDAVASMARNADPDDLAVALQAADEPLRAKVLRNLPRAEAKRLRRRVKEIGPVRVNDVEAARMRVAQALHRQEEAGV